MKTKLIKQIDRKNKIIRFKLKKKIYWIIRINWKKKILIRCDMIKNKIKKSKNNERKIINLKINIILFLRKQNQWILHLRF